MAFTEVVKQTPIHFSMNYNMKMYNGTQDVVLQSIVQIFLLWLKLKTSEVKSISMGVKTIKILQLMRIIAVK